MPERSTSATGQPAAVQKKDPPSNTSCCSCEGGPLNPTLPCVPGVHVPPMTTSLWSIGEDCTGTWQPAWNVDRWPLIDVRIHTQGDMHGRTSHRIQSPSDRGVIADSKPGLARRHEPVIRP